MKLLPKELNYLEQAAQELAKIPEEEFNEDVDTSPFDAALRKRVKGLKLRDAVSRLTEDQAILKRWLRETKITNAAVGFITAALMRPRPLARQLLAPPPPPEPTVSGEMAEDWTSKQFPRRLDIFKDKVFCSISILDKLGFDILSQNNSHREELQQSSNNPWANLGVWSRNSVEFGKCHGEKSIYVQQGKTNWKQVDYLLKAPGGYVNVHLGHQKGRDFDEKEFEQKLHTLKILPPESIATA